MDFINNYDEIIISSVFDELLLEKIERFIKKHETHENFKSVETHLAILKIQIHNNIGNHQIVIDSVNIIMDEVKEEQKALIVMLKADSLKQMDKKNEAISLLETSLGEDPFNCPFRKIDSLAKIIEMKKSEGEEQYFEEYNDIKEYFDYVGYVGNNDKTIAYQIIDLNKINLSSNRAYGKMLIKYYSVNVSNKKELLNNYISSEPLGYYRKMAKELLFIKDL